MGRTETLFIYVVLPNKHFVLWHNVAVHCGGVWLQRAWCEKTASRVKDAERQSAEYVMTFMSPRQTQCAVLFQRRNSETRTGNRVVFRFFFSLSLLQHFAQQLHPCTTSRGTWGLGTLRISGVLVASADATRIWGQFALAQRLLPGAECGSSWRSSTGPVRFMTLRLNTLLQATFHTVPREEEKPRTMALRASAVTPVFLCVVAKFWIVCV